MAEQILKNVKIYFGGQSLGGSLNQAQVTYNSELKDKTVFGSSCRKRVAGLPSVDFTASGFWDASTGNHPAGSTGVFKPDDYLFDEIGSSAEVLTIIPNGTALGNRAFFTESAVGEYSPAGQIGELFGFSFVATGDGVALIRGTLMEAGSLSTTITGTARNLGIPTSTQNLYAALHVEAVSSSGATLRAEVITDSSSSFGVSPSTAIVIPTTAVNDTRVGTGHWATTAGTTTNTWYKVMCLSSSGTTPSFTGNVCLGLY